ncbi:MAG: DUF1177 domain-containing protein [Firmicutes bacterium]|nr:DUF1177 domain-containing protein [Bacillota bacterium]MCL5039885.1 DUF1177 domain-containing protein [Bacillota bacterium]
MTWLATLKALDLLDDAHVNGEVVASLFKEEGLEGVEVIRISTEEGATDFIRIYVPGSSGKRKGGPSQTLGIIGRLGGVGARPQRTGLVSDADGAVAALAVALKLARMRARDDQLPGDVIIATHICPRAPVIPHEPVPFMGAPVDMATMNQHEVSPDMDAVLSLDTTKGNRIINRRGFAITPTVKEGYILRVSEDLLDLMQVVTGQLPTALAITIQDITPYGNGLYHLNSILQPATATSAPVVGVAITTETAVAGSATGASHLDDIESAVRFAIEVAKAFGLGQCSFYDQDEFKLLVDLYGPMNHLQTPGKSFS